jgi:hypothetical protein
LLFIPIPPWLNCCDGYRRSKKTIREPNDPMIQMKTATVSDTKVSFSAP